MMTCLARASGPARSGVLYEVCTLVCLFEGEVPEEAFKTYRVSVNSLSSARGLHRHLAIKVSRDLTIGHRLVRVIAEEIEVDISAVSAAVDMHAWFSVGHRRGRPPLCWHVARLHHRCRLLAPPDATCESIGSQIRWFGTSVWAASVRPFSRTRRTRLRKKNSLRSRGVAGKVRRKAPEIKNKKEIKRR